MGRGKIEIKRIENTTNRQVTYSKRRTGIVKKAKELTVLCDAEVSLIMFSSTGKLSEYISPSTTTKRLYDQYQQVTGTNLWNSHYEKLQESLKKQKEINMRLRKEIRQRIGEGVDDMSFDDLRGLEQDLDTSVKIVRDRKYHMIATQTETYRKKEARGEDPYYEEDYESILAMSNSGAQILSYRLQPHQRNQEEEGYGSYNLRI
ncbi:hypothetical protein IFM89_037319 [Coptis chinensis]|uniref:MADS transcription factor AP3-3 n=1 Tax=Coptis chinensis TaxID=261450 RepID=A0A835HQ38_9MAGN|nr:hypothetical protein IFM89_037319 [Coptis chinensis]